MRLRLTILPGSFSICRLNPGAALPHWLQEAEFFSVTKTTDELSIVAARTDLMEEDIVCSHDWRILKIEGPLDLALIGITAEVSGILKDAGIAIFTISTFDTDYILLKDSDLGSGIRALNGNGHDVSGKS